MTPAQRYCFLQTEIHSHHDRPEAEAMECYVIAAYYDRLLGEKEAIVTLGDYPELDREPRAGLGSNWLITALILVLVIGMLNDCEAASGAIVFAQKGGFTDYASLIFVCDVPQKHGLIILDSKLVKYGLKVQAFTVWMYMFRNVLPSRLERNPCRKYPLNV